MAEMDSKLDKNHDQIGNVMKLVQEQATVIRDLSHQVRILPKINTDLENRSRRLNLVFYGIDDNHRSERWEQAESLVKGICATNLGIELQLVQRAELVGRFYEQKKRPIIVNFSSDKEKMAVLKNAGKFKGSLYGVEQDLSFETRAVRKKLWEYGKVKKVDKKILRS